MKSGQARILDDESFLNVIKVVEGQRYPEKNTAILQISFKLGLRVQEIALLEIKEVARLLPSSFGGEQFTLNEILALPASYTKGSNALRSSSAESETRTLSFKPSEFDKVVADIVERAAHGLPVNPENFYPAPRKTKGKSRDLPMADEALRESLVRYLKWRMEKYPDPTPGDPLFMTQKGGPYSPHTLQEHIGLMLKSWGGVERASSHSGRRTLLTKVIKKTKDIKAAQQIAGHKQPATTLIYTEATESDLRDALKSVVVKSVSVK